MKKLTTILVLMLVFSHFVKPQSTSIDTLRAQQDLLKAQTMLEKRQFDKFDSILVYSDRAAVVYTQYQNWKGLLASLCCEIEVFARNSSEENVLILNDSICKISNSKLGGESIFTADAMHFLGLVYYYSSKQTLALENYQKALSLRLKLLGPNSVVVSNSYNNIGILCFDISRFDEALDNYYKSLSIRKERFGEKSVNVAICYNNIGNAFNAKSDYKKALENFSKALLILRDIPGENDNLIATLYSNFGVIYLNTSEFDKAIEYQLKSIMIYKKLLGEKNSDLAISYMNIAVIYNRMMEYDRSLDYFKKALTILVENFGEKNIYVASCCDNIGMTYAKENDFENALKYCLKGLNIRQDLLGDQHIDIVKSYGSIGNIYRLKKVNKLALENYFIALDLFKKIAGENYIENASIYSNIGAIYEEEMNFDEALKYYFKDLTITKELLGVRNSNIAICYNNIGDALTKKYKYKTALSYYQKALYSNCKYFNDSVNVLVNPNCKDYYSSINFLISLVQRGRVFEVLADSAGVNGRIYLNGKDYSGARIYQLALQNFLMCDTLIIQTRKKLNRASDKLVFGEMVAKVYAEAIRFCVKMSKMSLSERELFAETAFYFLEQNKGAVLLEALANTEGMSFAGIPDSLIKEEHALKVDISFYENKLAEGCDSLSQIQFQSNLFVANRQYELLIADFERNYPEYFKLKYSIRIPIIKDVQKVLDKKTALRSYFIGDTTIFICTLTSKGLDFQQVNKSSDFDDLIQSYRYALTGAPKFSENIQNLGMMLYKQLFPEKEVLSKKIDNLIIVPDGSLAFIPFESLPTGQFVGNKTNDTMVQDSLRGFKNVSKSISPLNFKNYPFLINRFCISYAYSATLYYQACLDEKKSLKGKPNLLAIAPVFSDKQSITSGTNGLQQKLLDYKIDSLSTRGMLLNGEYVSPLPGTELEVDAIQKEFVSKGLRTKLLLKNDATEKVIKSGIINDFRIIHLATHGFVNSEKPELSGILLAQDSTGGQDGILYSGELYNIKLKADLTVLSACETGLGKVRKGEGIIGLTRALLYAGSKNIIVSLWPVSDQSTSDLMIYFYKNLLDEKKDQSYSQWLRQAKLKMINEGKYSNPFYWSPFILVGK